MPPPPLSRSTSGAPERNNNYWPTRLAMSTQLFGYAMKHFTSSCGRMLFAVLFMPRTSPSPAIFHASENTEKHKGNSPLFLRCNSRVTVFLRTALDSDQEPTLLGAECGLPSLQYEYELVLVTRFTDVALFCFKPVGFSYLCPQFSSTPRCLTNSVI